MKLLCALLCCLQNRLGAGLIEGRYIDGLCPDRQAGDCCQYSNANSKFGHSLRRFGELPVRIDDELVRDAGVEVLVTFRRLLKTDHLDIDDLGDGQSVPEYRLHELPIVLQHRRLAGMERVRLCPAKTEAQAEIAAFGCLLLR